MVMLKLIAVIFIGSYCLAEEQTDSELISKGMQYAGECAMEAKINYDVCLQMFDSSAKHDDPKFTGCKCIIPCVSKKMNTMTPDGKFKQDEILKLINDLKAPGFKEEGLKVYELCKNVEGTNCDAGFNLVKCILTNSEKARNLTMMLVKTMQGKA